jgi:prepilin-type N-terminal cleavage/methylation domain-containing protein
VHNRQHKEEVVKRKGFTLIELMVVIAIIIILAAIAIPNYLRMTERAKRSRVSADMATLATVLETYKTDWGTYPVTTASPPVGITEVLPAATAVGVYGALSGNGGTGALQNVPAQTNAVGEAGGIEYVKAGTLTSMTNPWGSSLPGMTYRSIVAGSAVSWRLYMQMSATTWLMRTDGSSTVVETASNPGS